MKNKKIDQQSRYRGCLYGLAVGDALGAPVEFLSSREILKQFGKDGIRDFAPWHRFPAGSYTDDTQMSLATALGCIRAAKPTTDHSTEPTAAVHRQYLEWLELQNPGSLKRRAPGNTCLSALRSGAIGTFEHHINDSKGCGGVMRTAPAGLAYPAEEAFRRGAEFAAITHGHPTGFLTAGFLAMLVALLADGGGLDASLDRATTTLHSYRDHKESLAALTLARSLAAGKHPSEAAIPQIGEGWIAEEALAIAVYCALMFSGDFPRAVIAAVNHSGDSDSTGSITGAILGTLLGIDAIPSSWVRDVEDSKLIGEIADDLFQTFSRPSNST